MERSTQTRTRKTKHTMKITLAILVYKTGYFNWKINKKEKVERKRCILVARPVGVACGILSRRLTSTETISGQMHIKDTIVLINRVGRRS